MSGVPPECFVVRTCDHRDRAGINPAERQRHGVDNQIPIDAVSPGNGGKVPPDPLIRTHPYVNWNKELDPAIDQNTSPWYIRLVSRAEPVSVPLSWRFPALVKLETIEVRGRTD